MEIQLPESTEHTFEKVWAMFRESERQWRESERQWQEWRTENERQFQQKLQEQREESERQWRKQREESERQWQKQREENERQRQKQQEENERLWRETVRELKESEKKLDRTMGELGRKFGSMVEHMMIPNMIEKFRQLGYSFEKSAPNVLIQDEKNELYAQIDLFLENGDCAMVVEVKAQANINDIKEHVNRMEKLRQYADLHHDKRALFGAVAAAIMPKNVRDYAMKQGFYIIEQSGDTVNITAPPEKARAW
ncbi:MAG: DUF4670 domain-containing protein [Spirochaetaceae bacterium]|jgi:hypothetical protein|nr:DUF4670 domain-containing protein [Spirochaetaceae bacterium]